MGGEGKVGEGALPGVPPSETIQQYRAIAERHGFELLHSLGQGGQGTVFKAIRLTKGPSRGGLARPVALKFLVVNRQDPALPARFEREANILHELDDPRVVDIYDHFLQADIPFFVMKYVDGVSFRDLLMHQREPLDPRVAAFVVAETCLALHALHTRVRETFVHRDVKPGNILINRSGNVYLSDFGLARSSDGESLTKTGAMVGTFSYMSPEFFLSEGTVDQRSDIWSLGVLLAFACTGRNHFFTKGAPSLADRILHTRRKLMQGAPEEWIAEVAKSHPDCHPDQLQAVVARALRKNPAERYSSAWEMEAELRAYLLRFPRTFHPTEALGTLVEAIVVARELRLDQPAGLSKIEDPASFHEATSPMPRVDADPTQPSVHVPIRTRRPPSPSARPGARLARARSTFGSLAPGMEPTDPEVPHPSLLGEPEDTSVSRRNGLSSAMAVVLGGLVLLALALWLLQLFA